MTFHIHELTYQKDRELVRDVATAWLKVGKKKYV